MKKSMMSVDAMVDMYLHYGLADDTWSMMYNMTLHGLISNENWKAFYEKCKDWVWSDDEKDFVNDNNVIVNGAGKVIYYYNENGILTKAA